MVTKRLVRVRLSDAVEVFIESLLELPFSLSYIQFVAVSTFQTVDEIAAGAAVVAATFVSNSR